jgi:peptide/nickel transport system permease protein
VSLAASPSAAPRRGSGTAWLRRMSLSERAGVLALGLITLIAVFAPHLTPYDPQLRVAPPYLPPSLDHPFGTDEIGRDLLSRVIIGIRLTWLPGLAIILAGLSIGTVIGLVAGALGGWIDAGLQRLTELFLVLPSTLIALAVVAALGPGLGNTMLAMTLFWWPWYARISRTEIRAVAARPHAEAARLAGVSGPRLLFRYLLPSALPALLVTATLDVATVVLMLSLFSFLGLGTPAPAPELGAMTANAVASLTVYWWLPIIPAAVIFVLCFAANLAGDGVRVALKGV